MDCSTDLSYNIKGLFAFSILPDTVIIIHINAYFYLGIWFSFAQKAHSLNGTFVLPTKFLYFPVSKIHRKTELYVLQESAIWLLLLVLW